MTLPALADLDAFKVRLGFELPEDEEPRAQAALEDASSLARAEAGTTWVDEDEELLDDIPDVVVTIVLRAARRSFQNPDELEEEGSGSHRVKFRDVYLTNRECELIRAAATEGPATALGVVATTRGPIDTAPLVCTGGVYPPSVEETDPVSLME